MTLQVDKKKALYVKTALDRTGVIMSFTYVYSASCSEDLTKAHQLKRDGNLQDSWNTGNK